MTTIRSERHPKHRRTGHRSALLALILILGTFGGLSGRQAARVWAQQNSGYLAPGWNNVLYLGVPGPLTTALSPLAGNLSGVLIWDSPAQRWHQYYPGAAAGNDLQTMLTGQVYWIGVQYPTALPPAVVTSAPVQLVPGWNNVSYMGPGVVGSSILEQGPAWTWDPSGQKWLFRDPSRPNSSDFQGLTLARPYWVYVSGSAGSQSAATAATATPRATGCFQYTSAQPGISEVEDALSRAGQGSDHSDPGLELPLEHSGTDGNGPLQAPFVPPTILRSIAWIETSWHQAVWDVQRGQSGPTLTSSGCAYGVMQIVSGMQVSSSPTGFQRLVGGDFRANAQAGAQLLARNWNRDASVLPVLGRHDPHVLEDWYYAIWAYHCFGDTCGSYGAHDNPDDPTLTWPRPAYNSQAQTSSQTSFSYSDYPYQELVFGLISNPPSLDGRAVWSSIQVQLPPHGSVGFPQPLGVAEPSAHLDDGRSLPPAVIR